MTISRFRHTQSHAAKPNQQFLNVTPSPAIWDGSNTIACNKELVAVPWKSMGSTAVFSHANHGRVHPNTPLLQGQSGNVIDVAFNPFHTNLLFTASEDGSIMGWRIPDGGLHESCSDPFVSLLGHSKKCGILCFHPSADNVLASAGMDRIVNVWDIESGSPKTAYKGLEDSATGLDWNVDGSLLCCTSRDKKLSLFDPRSGDAALSTESHLSARSQRCIWAKRRNNILTFGFDGSQRREIRLWDPRNIGSPLSFIVLDQASSVMMPAFDEDTNLLYLCSKGEGGVRTFELIDGALISSFQFNATEPLRGMCLFPKTCMSQKDCEIARLYQLGLHSLYSVSMTLPRKNANEQYQPDVYPPTFAPRSAISAKEYFGGKSAIPIEEDMEPFFNETKECKTLRNEPSPETAPLPRKHTDPNVETPLTVASNTTSAEPRPTSPLADLLELLKTQRQRIEDTKALLSKQTAELLETVQAIEEKLSS